MGGPAAARFRASAACGREHAEPRAAPRRPHAGGRVPPGRTAGPLQPKPPRANDDRPPDRPVDPRGDASDAAATAARPPARQADRGGGPSARVGARAGAAADRRWAGRPAGPWAPAAARTAQPARRCRVLAGHLTPQPHGPGRVEGERAGPRPGIRVLVEEGGGGRGGGRLGRHPPRPPSAGGTCIHGEFHAAARGSAAPSSPGFAAWLVKAASTLQSPVQCRRLPAARKLFTECIACIVS
jgi:hypothetical protein